MKLYVPYTKLNPATRITVWEYDFEFVKLKGKYGYSEFLKERWDEGKDFLLVEHDVVVWPGAIESLVKCTHPWCAFDYSKDTVWETQEAELRGIPLGCVKITSDFIKQTPDIWDNPVDWHVCDLYLFKCAKEKGLFPHQHFPGVVNANPTFLGRRKM